MVESLKKQNEFIKNQSNNCVSLGFQSGYTGQNDSAVSIGNQSGQYSQGTSSVAIGSSAGNYNQQTGAIALGDGAGYTQQGSSSIAIGSSAGNNYQGGNAIAIGSTSGSYSQQYGAVAIGLSSGQSLQGTGCISIGQNAGAYNQQVNSIAIGTYSGFSFQGSNAIAIGNNAGSYSQGTGAIAIGYNAASYTQGANSICLNATTNTVSCTEPSSFVVQPMRSSSTTAYSLYYEINGFGTSGFQAGEVFYSTSSSKYKNNIINITKDTSVLHNFEMKEWEDKTTGKPGIGFIAEEVSEFDEFLILRDENNEINGLNEQRITLYAINELIKLRKEVDALKAQVASLTPP